MGDGDEDDEDEEDEEEEDYEDATEDDDLEVRVWLKDLLCFPVSLAKQ